MLQPEKVKRRVSIVQFFDQAQQNSYNKFKLNLNKFQSAPSRRGSYHQQLADDIQLFKKPCLKNQIPQIVVTSRVSDWDVTSLNNIRGDILGCDIHSKRR